jgi:hypothetical protein
MLDRSPITTTLHPTDMALQPSGLDLVGIERIAVKALVDTGAADELPINVGKVIAGNGGRIEVTGPPVPGLTTPDIEIYANHDYLVRVPASLGRPRQRFLAACGLARHLLHYSYHLVPPYLPQPSGDPNARMQWEAHAFAAALLMPRTRVQEALAEGLDTAHGLAYHFHVTEALIDWRIQMMQTLAPDT